jgi:hypothetical protein
MSGRLALHLCGNGSIEIDSEEARMTAVLAAE